MEYRQASRADLPGILSLYRQLDAANAEVDADAAGAVWALIEANPALRYFVAAEGDEIVATCNLSLIPNLTHGCRPFAVIENVVADEAHRGQGIGRRVVQMAIDAAREAGCYKVQLLSGAQRTGAHAFYERLGFSGTAKRGFHMRLD